MDKVVKKLKNRKQFFEALDTRRVAEENALFSKSEEETIPVFNTKLFTAQTGVVLTAVSRNIMAENERNLENKDYSLTESQIRSMTPVVEGLAMIHHDIAHVKDVLSHVATLEMYGPRQYIKKKNHEDSISCYFILHGTVEATYDYSLEEKIQVYESNILYVHGSGECIGIVNHESERLDMASPSTIYTKEHCHMIRIDRKKFHSLIQTKVRDLNQQKAKFLTKEKGFLSQISLNERLSLQHILHKVVFPANKIVSVQDEIPDGIYFIQTGHFQCCRKLESKDSKGEPVIFDFGLLGPGEIFGQNCILGRKCQSYIYSSSLAVCYKLKRDDLVLIRKEKIFSLLKTSEITFPEDKITKERAVVLDAWSKYKTSTVDDFVSRLKCDRSQPISRPFSHNPSRIKQMRRTIDRPRTTSNSLRSSFNESKTMSKTGSVNRCRLDPSLPGQECSCQFAPLKRKLVDAREIQRLFANEKPVPFNHSLSQIVDDDKENAGLLILDSSEMVVQAQREARRYREELEEKRRLRVKEIKVNGEIYDARDLAKEKIIFDRYRMGLITLKLSRLKSRTSRINKEPSRASRKIQPDE